MKTISYQDANTDARGWGDDAARANVWAEVVKTEDSYGMLEGAGAGWGDIGFGDKIEDDQAASFDTRFTKIDGREG